MSIPYQINLPCGRSNPRYADLNAITDRDGYLITHIETTIEALDSMLDGEVDLELPNGLADEIARMDDAGFVKYMAALEHADVLPIQEYDDPIKTFGKCCYCTACINDFEFFPEVTTQAWYGEHEFYAMHGIANTSANGMDFFDYHGYGSACMEADNAAITRYGLIRSAGLTQTETETQTDAPAEPTNQMQHL